MTPLTGQSLRRFEDARFLTGKGRFTADLRTPGETTMVVVRSPTPTPISAPSTRPPPSPSPACSASSPPPTSPP